MEAPVFVMLRRKNWPFGRFNDLKVSLPPLVSYHMVISRRHRNIVK
jgi:hypothetical protein